MEMTLTNSEREYDNDVHDSDAHMKGTHDKGNDPLWNASLAKFFLLGKRVGKGYV